MNAGEMLKAIAEPTRFRIVQLLRERHHCSRSLSLALGISESAVSQHMTVLKEQGLVMGTRHGYHIHYALNPRAIGALAHEFTDWLSDMEGIENCHDGNPCEFRDNGGCCKAKGVQRCQGRKVNV